MTQEATDTRNIYQRMHAVMEAVDYIQKERKSGMRYTIVSHDAVTAKVRPVLVQNRVVYYPVKISRTQDGNRTQVDATIRFVNIDNPTDFMDVESCGYGIDDQDKGPGKGISYSVKYALLKALGLETGDDPDEQDVPHIPEPKVKAKVVAPPTKADETLTATILAAMDLCETDDDAVCLLGKHSDILEKMSNGDELRSKLIAKAMSLCKTSGDLISLMKKHSEILDGLNDGEELRAIGRRMVKDLNSSKAVAA